MKNTQKEKQLCDFGGTKMPKTLGNTIMMNTDILSKIQIYAVGGKNICKNIIKFQKNYCKI